MLSLAHASLYSNTLVVLRKNSTNSEVKIRPYGNDCDRLVIINTVQNNCRIKILPMRAGGGKGAKFLYVKISSYTVIPYSIVYKYN